LCSLWPERYNIFFVTRLPPEPFLQMLVLFGVSSPRPLPTEKVHWIINSKYVRWRSVPFSFVHSNVVAFSYNFGCKYNFFCCVSISLSPFHCFHTYWRQCGVTSTGIREKKKKKNLAANVYANADNGPLQSAAPVKTTPTMTFKHTLFYNVWYIA